MVKKKKQQLQHQQQTNQQTKENENKTETNKQTLQFCFENVIVPGHRQWGPTDFGRLEPGDDITKWRKHCGATFL